MGEWAKNDRRTEGTSLSTIEYLAHCHCRALDSALPDRGLNRPPGRSGPVNAPSAEATGPSRLQTLREHWHFSSLDPTQIQRYRFGGRTADFLICRECGVYVGVQMTTDQGRYGVLNVLSLTPQPAGLPAPAPMEYGRRDRRGPTVAPRGTLDPAIPRQPLNSHTDLDANHTPQPDGPYRTVTITTHTCESLEFQA